MIRTKKIYAKGYYLFRGEASANSCFIENLREAKLFIRLVNRYLKDYVKVHDYLLTAEGWLIQVTIRSRKQVLQAFGAQKACRLVGSDSIETWRIISEQVRLMLSQYVKRTNKMEGRSGSKVKESYHRYYFSSAREAQEYIQAMRQQKIKLLQRNKKYRKVKSHYTIPKEEGKGSVFLCSRWKNKKKSGVNVREKIGLECLELEVLEPLVVQNLVKSTMLSQINTNAPPKF